jgi:hypothetical protein
MAFRVVGGNGLVTRKAGEELEESYIIQKTLRLLS